MWLGSDWHGHFHHKNWEAPKLSDTGSKQRESLICTTKCRKSVEFIAIDVVEAKGLDKSKERLDKHLEEWSIEGYESVMNHIHSCQEIPRVESWRLEK